MTHPSAHCKLADNCARCMNGTGHPPLVAVYDREKGSYAIASGAVCMARWASSGHAHGAGDLCGAEAAAVIAGIDLCVYHAERLRNWHDLERPGERVREKTDRLRQADRDYEQALEESERYRDEALAARSIVYYIRRTSDGAVKIGTATEFSTRKTALRGEHGELQVLLTHGCTVTEERAMHAKFRAYRIGRSEWFVPAKELLRWIDGRRGRHGEPQSRTWMSKGDLRKLIATAPGDRDLTYRNGAVRWPPLAAVTARAS